MKKHTDTNFGAGYATWQILERLEHRGLARDTCFTDWLDLMLSAQLSLTDTMGRGDVFDKLKHSTLDGVYEDRYTAIVQRYADTRSHGQRNINLFVDAWASLQIETRKTNADVLGYIYQARITFGQHGQYFTPAPIAAAMAQIVGDGDGKVYDPTCGSGTMLIEAAKVNPERKFYGKDLDIRCAMMCVINMWLFDLNAVVEWGDTLANKTYKRWIIRRGGYIMEIEPPIVQEKRPEQGSLPLAA